MDDGWMEKRWLIFASFRHFQQYISHFRTYRDLIWGWLCGTKLGSLSLVRLKLLTVSVYLENGAFSAKIL